jgi:hypothetical protein
LTTGEEAPESRADVVAVRSPAAAAAMAAADLAVPLGEGEAGGREGALSVGLTPGVAGVSSWACLSRAGLQYSAIRFMSALLRVSWIEVIPFGTPSYGVA